MSAMPTFRGEGPGAQSGDGCSVELYRRLPYLGEVELIEPWIRGDAVLELGCGAGRLTRRLLERGYRVTAVDNSAEMLEHAPRDATLVRANIEDLALGADFDTVILASALLNNPDNGVRMALLAAAHRHLRPGGALLFERYDPDWLSHARAGRLRDSGEVQMHLDRIERHDDHVEMSLRYRIGDDEWLHHFAAASLGDAEFSSCLIEAGFDAPAWIGRQWGRALKHAA
jgi:SAM-dependent methyltransferase